MTSQSVSCVCVSLLRRCDRRSRKTLEGTAAAIASVLLALAAAVRAMNGRMPTTRAWVGLSGCTVLACALEAITSQIDNLFLPLFYQTALLIAAAAELRCG